MPGFVDECGALAREAVTQAVLVRAGHQEVTAISLRASSMVIPNSPTCGVVCDALSLVRSALDGSEKAARHAYFGAGAAVCVRDRLSSFDPELVLALQEKMGGTCAPLSALLALR